MTLLILNILFMLPAYFLAQLSYRFIFGCRLGLRPLWLGYCLCVAALHTATSLHDMTSGPLLFFLYLELFLYAALPLALRLCFEGRADLLCASILPYTLINSLAAAPFMMPVSNALLTAQTAAQALPWLALFLGGALLSVVVTVWLMRRLVAAASRWPKALCRALGVVSTGLYLALQAQQCAAIVWEENRRAGAASLLQLAVTVLFAALTVLLFALPCLRQQRQEVAAINAQQQRLYALLQEQLRDVERLHLAQHDMQNHFVTIQGFLQRGDRPSALAYINDLLAAEGRDAHV